MSLNREIRRLWNWLPLVRLLLVIVAVMTLVPLAAVIGVRAQSSAIDPGVRGGPAAAGGPIGGLTSDQNLVFNSGKQNFIEVNGVTMAETGDFGLGPRFDSNQCNGCHSQPAVGGSSPFNNGSFIPFNDDGAFNYVPFFETANGPTVVPRFPQQLTGPPGPDGHVHQLFTITGRIDAGSCNIQQPDFSLASTNNDLIFRNTTPIFGEGLVEIINDRDILSNQTAECVNEGSTGICGVANTSSDGSIGRFGWKAQNRSMLIFAAEAYNTEEGVTTEDFPNETDETSGCVINPLPEDHEDFNLNLPPHRFSGDPERFALFMRMLAPPTPGPSNASTMNGQTQFNTIGCNICHTTSFTTPVSAIGALSNIKASLFSDLLAHHMGSCDADGITQGYATGDMFRTPLLWGVGQRVFFMHDGRTSDIVQAVEDHSCVANGQYPNSEANAVIASFNALTTKNQQDLINFLRSL